MTTAPQGIAPKAPKLFKKRVIALFLSFFILGIFTLIAYIRGTWAETTERNPTSPQDKMVIQLYQNSQGQKIVRGSVLLDAPVSKVWGTITNYEKFTQIFKNMTSLSAKKIEENVYQLDGTAHTFLGDYPFQTKVKHEESPTKNSVSWSESSDPAITLNRGGWTLIPKEKQTLVVYSLELEMKSYPTFIVRNFLMIQTKLVLKEIQASVAQPSKN